MEVIHPDNTDLDGSHIEGNLEIIGAITLWKEM